MLEETHGRSKNADPETGQITLVECRQTIKVHERELLRLVTELAEGRSAISQYRKEIKIKRRRCARLWSRCRDRIEQIELMRDIIRSSSDGKSAVVGEAAEMVSTESKLLADLGELIAQVDSSTDEGLRRFLSDLSEFTEFAKDLFDYAGVKLVYELSEILADYESTPEGRRKLFERVLNTHRTARSSHE